VFDPGGVTRLAVIGLGHRATAMIASMQTGDPGVSVRAVADPATESARRLPRPWRGRKQHFVKEMSHYVAIGNDYV
jgi:predicted dehydrogenase